jgi:hypothetical protein
MAPPPLTRVDFPLYGREFPGYSHQGYVIWGMNVCQFFTNDADGSSLFVLTRQNVARDFAEAFNAVDQALFGSTGSHIQHATAVYLDEYDTAQVVTPLPAGVTKVRRLAGVIAASRQPMSFEERKAIARQLLELIEQVNLPGDAPYCGITIFDHILVERTPTEIAVTWIPEISKVAAITTAQASSQTSNGFQISAPEVMAEEDPRQEKVEIFMLGLYLYQLLTGKSFAAGYGGKSHQLNQDIANGVISQRIADEISMLAPLVRMNPMERELTGLAQALAAYNP